MRNEDKYLQVVKEEKIFSKIISFFKNIFSFKLNKNRDNPEIETEQVITKKEEAKKDFWDELRIDKSYDSNLLSIQEKYEAGNLDLADLTEEEYESLKELYTNQIKDLERSITNKQTEINMLLFKKNGYIKPGTSNA